MPRPYQGRNNHQNRRKVSIFVMLTMLVALVFYGYYFFYNNHEEIKSRCMSELANVKYQLDSKYSIYDRIANVLEYKKTMDSMINDIQQECFIQKQSLKDFSNSFILMKHHLEICEMQTEDLELECKELKEKLEKANVELRGLKKAPG